MPKCWTRDRVRGRLVPATYLSDTNGVRSRKPNSPSAVDGKEPQNRFRVGLTQISRRSRYPLNRHRPPYGGGGRGVGFRSLVGGGHAGRRKRCTPSFLQL